MSEGRLLFYVGVAVIVLVVLAALAHAGEKLPAPATTLQLMVTDESGDFMLVTPVEQPSGPVDCALRGQMLAQGWMRAHPGWHFVGWRCSPGTPA
ncbi:MAG TPA: hypothetical protein VMU93_06565 [Caulobacteraceae bacterium]|nr:hypothetical protein [Caulobacteraceae bacterium]